MSLFVFFWLYLLLFHNQTRICNNSFLFQEIHLCNLARLFWMYHVCQEMVSPVNILSCFFFWCFFWKPVSPFSCAKNISILRVICIFFSWWCNLWLPRNPLFLRNPTICFLLFQSTWHPMSCFYMFCLNLY